MRSKFQWVIFDKDNDMYSLSNANTKREAIRGHLDFFAGQNWAQRRKEGDKVLKVKITI